MNQTIMDSQIIINEQIYEILNKMNQIDTNMLDILDSVIMTNTIQSFCIFMILIILIMFYSYTQKNRRNIKKLELRIKNIENKTERS